MLAIFRAGLKDLREIWLEALGAGDLGEVESLGARPDRGSGSPSACGRGSCTIMPSPITKRSSLPSIS
jgi:hypothetical protein